MRKLFALAAAFAFTGCLSANEADEPADDTAPPPYTAYNYSYYQFGWARIGATGALGDHSSAPGGIVQPINVSYGGTGNYYVTFNGLGSSTLVGHWQVTAEGQNSNTCQIKNVTSSSINPQALVVCASQSLNAIADTPFSIMYYRYDAPVANTNPLTGAYTLVRSTGTLQAGADYNSRGAANSVTHGSTGNYTVTLTGGTATSTSDSILVTPFSVALGTTCSVSAWSGASVAVQCRTRLGALVDAGFWLSFASVVPALNQQGAHAVFSGASLSSAFSLGLGKRIGCSAVSLTGALAGTAALITVTGELNTWDATPFVRASFVTGYSDGEYCKVEGVTSGSSTPPNTTSTTTVRCYTPTGTVISSPHALFTHVTSDRANPC